MTVGTKVEVTGAETGTVETKMTETETPSPGIKRIPATKKKDGGPTASAIPRLLQMALANLVMRKARVTQRTEMSQRSTAAELTRMGATRLGTNVLRRRTECRKTGTVELMVIQRVTKTSIIFTTSKAKTDKARARMLGVGRTRTGTTGTGKMPTDGMRKEKSRPMKVDLMGIATELSNTTTV